jgi:hypothetical protein
MNSPVFIHVVLLISLIIPATSYADNATCKIKIEDVNKGATYTLEQAFDYVKDGAARIKEFDTPGNDYVCRLAFFDILNGTMLSCEYKKDMGQTFFQSDRSLLKEASVSNNLTFRHQSSFINIQTVCE